MGNVLCNIMLVLFALCYTYQQNIEFLRLKSLVNKSHALSGFSSRGGEWDHSERCKGATENKKLCFGDVTSDAYSASCYHKKPLI